MLNFNGFDMVTSNAIVVFPYWFPSHDYKSEWDYIGKKEPQGYKSEWDHIGETEELRE